jgi:hypothetical protein
MAETKSTFYSLLLTRTQPNKDLPEISDFAYLIFIRQPGAKQASYIIAQANIPTATLVMIESEISAGSFPDYQLQIRHVKNDNENLIYSAYVKFILPKNYNQNKAGTTVKGTSPTIPVQFLLVNPVIWDMNTNNSFNRTFNDKKYTALEILELYLSELIMKKSKISSWIIGDRTTTNKTLYNQIVIPSTITELQVPEYIIGAYKPYSTPSLWLFDNFTFPFDDSEKKAIKNGELPLMGILLNFYNALENFTKQDISKDADIKQFTTLLKIIPYSDTLSFLSKPNAVVSFKNTTNMTQVTQLFGNLPKVTLTDNTKETQSQRVTSLEIEYTDNLEEAEKRIVDCVDLMQKQINQIEIYETINTSPEWLQFGYLYNLERDKKTGNNLNRYIHTPISIFNIFLRQEQTIGKMEHIIKYAMLRLNDKAIASGREWICDKSEQLNGTCNKTDCPHYKNHTKILTECPDNKDIQCPYNKFKHAKCK